MSDSKTKEENPEGAGDGASEQEDAAQKPDKKPSLSGHNMEFLSQYLAQSMGIREKPPSKLEEMTLKGIANYLNSDNCKNVVSMVGAGISTAAGIPDFRSPGTGLYDNLEQYNLPSPQAIFEIDFFEEQPKPFFVLAKELLPGSFKPTVSHYFIKMLSDKGKLLRHYTQNIDTLERVTGMDPERIIEAHGTFHTSHCRKCSKLFDMEWMKAEIVADKIPTCDEEGCDGVVKPDIVFFGESLPARFAKHVNEDFQKCDLLVVMGTSLQVQPFASLITRVPLECPRLYINLEPGMSCSNPISALIFGGGFEFDAPDNYRDVFKQATCDEGCQELADLLGWGEDLKNTVKGEHERIDKVAKSDGDKATGGAKGGSKQTTPASSSSSSSSKTTATGVSKGGSKQATPTSSSSSSSSSSKTTAAGGAKGGSKLATPTSSSKTTKKIPAKTDIKKKV